MIDYIPTPDMTPLFMCSLGVMGWAFAILLGMALIQAKRSDPADLIEMVDMEMDEWETQLAIHYSATLPRELRLDIRQRMIHVGRVMSERKSKSEDVK